MLFVLDAFVPVAIERCGWGQSYEVTLLLKYAPVIHSPVKYCNQKLHMNDVQPCPKTLIWIKSNLFNNNEGEQWKEGRTTAEN